MLREFRRIFVPFVCGIGITMAMLLPTSGQGAGGTGAIRWVISPTGKDREIHKELFEQIDSARREIRIMLFQFTSRDLMTHVRNMKGKVKVRLLLDAKQAINVKVSVHEELQKSGVEIRFVKMPGSGAESPKFHHKVLVVDEHTVVTGSYNWSVLADELNHENIVILRDAATAKAFAAEFDRIWPTAKETLE